MIFIEVPVASKESQRSCIYVLGVSILHLSTIMAFDFGIVLTCGNFFFILFIDI